MLYQRYGNPMQLLQQMFQVGSLNQFIDDLGQIIWQEKADKQRWDYWLHRVYGQDFDEYVRACEAQSKEPETTDMDNIETIMNNSNYILENFRISE